MVTTQQEHVGLPSRTDARRSTAKTLRTERMTRLSRQALYEELLEALLGAILEVDTYALDGLRQGEALRTLTRTDATMLWQVCCWSWQHSGPGGCVALRLFMASMRAWHPLLPLPEPTSPAPPFHQGARAHEVACPGPPQDLQCGAADSIRATPYG